MRNTFKCAFLIASVTLGAGAVAGCGASEGEATVFAAASLAAAFGDIAAGGDAAGGDAGDGGAAGGDAAPGSGSAVFSFGGSSGLVDQLVGGAPADVFAAADTANMDRAVAAGLIAGEPVQFATNELTLVTPPDNPAAITGLDTSLDGAKLVVCAPEVPCGRASRELAADAGIELTPVSEELSVTDVLGKVTSGEADAGLVYVTDASAAGNKVQQIEIAAAADHVNDYWIALVAGGDAEAGQAFIDQVMSAAGQKVLADYGFGAP